MKLRLNLPRNELKRLPWRVLIPPALIVLGTISIGLAVAADIIGVGTGGFGSKQILLLAVGTVGVFLGLATATPTGWQHVSAWHEYWRISPAKVSILLVAVWFGIIAGWMLVAIRYGILPINTVSVRKGVDYIWMAPLANLLIFVAVGLALTALNLRWPRLVSWRAAIAVLTFMFLMALFARMMPRLTVWAKAILALGLAVQIARLSTGHKKGFANLVRYSVGWPALLHRPAPGAGEPHVATLEQVCAAPTRREFLIGAGSTIAVAALGVYGWRALTEQRHLAAMPALAQPQMPNVLFIVLDTVRAQSMSMYGYARPTTPFLERFGAQGVVFERAISPCSWTLPSHASMFTGRHPHELSANWGVPLDLTYPTLAEVMASQGYLTAGFVSNTSYCSKDFGLHRGFQHYEDYPISLGELAQSSGYDQLLMDLTGHQYYLSRKRASQLGRNFLKWQSRTEGKPFFAFLNYFDAHAPYVPPKNLAIQYAGKAHPESQPFKLEEPFDPADIQELNDAYDACVAYLDQELEVLFNELSAKRILDDTLVLVTSDHGEEFYEHHLLEHGNGLYLAQTHVPLVLRFPSIVPASTRLEAPVGLRNLAITVGDIVGIQQATPFPGESLVAHWQRNGDPGVKPVLAEVDVPPWFPNSGPMKSVLVQPYHFIVNSDGREEVYQITRDSSELDDLAGTEEGQEVLPALRAALGSLLV